MQSQPTDGVEQSWDAIVIGTGFGGLALAIRLLSQGLKVLVVEKNSFIGGRARKFIIGQYTFDAGPTVLTGTHLIEDLFKTADESMEDFLELVPLDPYYRVFGANNQHFDFYRSKDKFLAEVARISTKDEKGAKKYLFRVEQIFDAFYPYTLRPMLQFRVMLTMLPFLFRHRAIESVRKLVRRHFSNSFLQSVMEFHPLLVGGNPASTPALYSLIDEFERKWGVYYCLGGTTQFVDALQKLIIKLGGKIELNAPVKKITQANGEVTGVELSSGMVLRSKIVVSNADPQHTYQSLLNKDSATATMRSWRWKSQRPSMSLYVFYFGLGKQIRPTPLAHHSILFGENPDKAISTIFSRDSSKVSIGEDYFYYVHLPTLTDDTIAPKNCDCLYVLAAVPALHKKTRSEKSQSHLIRQDILHKLENYLPGISSHIEVEHHIDPEYFETTLASPFGSAFSAQPTLLQSAWFRPHNRSPRFTGLYFVGAGTHPGAGVPAVLASAKIASDLIAKDFSHLLQKAPVAKAQRS
jgi:phytoene desaturase